jgi:soluble lytic murein transglycosylase-like protein
MKRQFLRAAGMVMLWNFPTVVHAQNSIQSFVNSDGKVVFANAPEPNAAIKTAAPDPKAPEESAPAKPAPEAATPGSIPSLIQSISSAHGVDPALVAAVVKVESDYDPWARSPKGALGLMQLIPPTGWRFGVRDFFDPQQNIEGGVRYLKFLLEMFEGNVDLSLAAYNAGENAVKRAGHRVPAIPETRDYVRRIRAIYKKSTSPVLAAQEDEFVPEAVSAGTSANTSVIFRTVDERGVVHFSNIAPPN